jgi:hypothetical protein
VSIIAYAAAVVAAGQTFVCTPTHVWDGDGPVWCAEGPHLRLSGIAAREMDGTCRSNQPCPDASAIETRDALVALLGGSQGQNRDGACRRFRSAPDMPLRRVCWRQPDRSLVPLSIGTRLVVHHGQDRHRAQVGSLLART